MQEKGTREEEARQKELSDFLTGFDFMRLGQLINRGQWESAMMTERRMEEKVRALSLHSMERQLGALRLAVIHRDKVQAKQILSQIVRQRVQLLGQLLRKADRKNDIDSIQEKQ